MRQNYSRIDNLISRKNGPGCCKVTFRNLNSGSPKKMSKKAFEGSTDMQFLTNLGLIGRNDNGVIVVTGKGHGLLA